MLVIAAVMKFFSPADSVRTLEKAVAFFELALAGVLVVFYAESYIWAAVGCLFSSWSGYAFFWFMHKLPCGCLGKWVHVPTSATFVFDLFCVALGFILTYLLGLRSKVLVVLCLLAAAFAVGSYFLAGWVYHNLLAIRWL